MATVTHKEGATNVTHYNVQPTFDVQAGVQDQDLGSVSKAIDALLTPVKKDGVADQTFPAHRKKQ